VGHFRFFLDGAGGRRQLCVARVWDVAGTPPRCNDAFYVKKDTTVPYAQNNQAGGDAAWQKDPGKLYDVNLYDTAARCLTPVEYSVWSAPGRTGTMRRTGAR